jgi:hypothetical protein
MNKLYDLLESFRKQHLSASDRKSSSAIIFVKFLSLYSDVYSKYNDENVKDTKEFIEKVEHLIVWTLLLKHSTIKDLVYVEGDFTESSYATNQVFSLSNVAETIYTYLNTNIDTLPYNSIWNFRVFVNTVLNDSIDMLNYAVDKKLLIPFFIDLFELYMDDKKIIESRI